MNAEISRTEKSSDRCEVMPDMSIKENIIEIQEEIAAAAARAGRDPSEITLIAVSKTKPNEMIREAAECGMTEFGENKPQELAAKFPEFEKDNVHWHLIGNLQKNKVRHIIDKAYLIHSVDSYELAAEINKRAAAIDKIQNILIQVNISGEETKSGVAPKDAAELCRSISELGNVRIMGLMTISVRDYTYEQNKALFSKLRDLAEDIRALSLSGVEMKELSMGMTHDFGAAIESGATMVRVGTAIFGARDYGVI